MAIERKKTLGAELILDKPALQALNPEEAVLAVRCRLKNSKSSGKSIIVN
jgi:hypothetical protein